MGQEAATRRTHASISPAVWLRMMTARNPPVRPPTAMNALRIQNIQFEHEHLTLALAGGKRFRLPLKLHEPLRQATPAQRLQWQLVNDGFGVAWPALAVADDTGMINSLELVWDDFCDEALAALRAVDWRLDRLATREREIVSLWRLQADGYNGGFIQFFCNWGEDTWQTARQALQAIGATATLEIVARQRALLTRLESSPDPIAPWDIPRLLTEAEAKEISEVLDLRLWDAAHEIPRLAALHYAAQG